MDIRVGEVHKFLAFIASGPAPQIGLMVSFDGASRGNPGPSASGVCAWWGSWQHGMFQECSLLLQKGASLGIGTNNTAESHGLASAFKISTRLYCWVIEQLSELAQHSVRFE